MHVSSLKVIMSQNCGVNTARLHLQSNFQAPVNLLDCHPRAGAALVLIESIQYL